MKKENFKDMGYILFTSLYLLLLSSKGDGKDLDL